MYGLSERWLGWPSAARSNRAAISRTRGDEFPQPFAAQKWQSFRRGHTRLRSYSIDSGSLLSFMRVFSDRNNSKMNQDASTDSFVVWSANK